MANLYDRPIPINIDIDPYKLPIDLIDKSLAKQQTNFNDVLKTYDDGLNSILSITGRPGVKSDEDFVRNLYETAKPKALDVLSNAQGSYSNLTGRNLQEEFEKVLLPNRETISALVKAKEVYGERKGLEAAEAQGKAVLLRFNDDVLTKPITNEDGSINNFESGAEAKLDWYGGIGKLFTNMTNNKFVKDKLGNVESPEQGIATIKKWLYQMETFGTIQGPNGVEDPRFADVLKGVIENQIDTFITTTQEGTQMYKWFKHLYAKEYKKTKPDASVEEIDQYSSQEARKEIKNHITNYGEKYKGKSITESESTQITRLPQERTGGAGFGSGEEAGDEVQINFGDVVDRGFGGSDIAGIDIEKEYERMNEDYVRFNYQVTDDPSKMVSLKQIQEYGSQVGPYDSQQKLSTLEGHQFHKRNSNTRGFLQQIGDDEIGGDYQKLNQHPTVFELKGKNNILEYKSYLEKNGKKHTQEYKDLEKLLNDKTNPALQDNFYTSLVLFEEDELGNLRPQINPFLEQLSLKNPKIKERIQKSKEWMERPVIAEKILQYTVPYTKMKNLRRSLWESMNTAAKNSGFSSYSAMNEELKKGGNNITNVAKKANETYYDAILDNIQSQASKSSMGLDAGSASTTIALRSLFTPSKQGIITTPAFIGGPINMNYFKDLDPTVSNKIGYAIVRDIDKVLNNPDGNYYITGKRTNLRDIMNRYNSLIETTIGKSTSEIFNTENLQKSLTALYNDLVKIYQTIDNGEKNSLNISNTLNSAKDKKAAYLQEKTKDSRFITYFDELDSKSKDFYIEGYTHILSQAGPTNYKHVLSSLEGLVKNANSHFRVVPQKEGKDLRTAYTYKEVIESTIDPSLKGKERDDAFNEAYKNMKLIGMSYDLDNGIVIDYEVKGVKFEVRPQTDQLPAFISLTRGENYRDLTDFKQITRTLKENNNTMGFLGDDKNPARQTQFFMIQKDGVHGKKGQFYIYQDGTKKVFDSAKDMINWHRANKEENFTAFQKAGTLLDMPEAEFKQAYPKTDRKALLKYYNDLFIKDIESSNISVVARNAGYDIDDLKVVKLSDDKSKVVFKNPVDDNRVLDDKYVTIVDGKREVKYETVPPTRGMTNKYPDDPTMVIGPLKDALVNLAGIMNAAGSPALVISNSLRDIQQMNKLYPNDKGINSPHLEGMAVDIRVSDTAGQNAVKWFKTTEGKKWLKDNNIAILIHKVPGGLDHIHMQYNKKLGKTNILPYLFKDERDGTIIN